MPKSKVRKEPMVLITFHIPEPLLKALDKLVEEGRFPSRSEAIRYAIRELLAKELQLKQREQYTPILG